MFTGLIETIGKVSKITRSQGGLVFDLTSEAWAMDELDLGESIAMDGVCLTVTKINPFSFQVLAGQETLDKTTVGQWKHGHLLNMERALKLGARLGGHWLQGHVDGVGKIIKRVDKGANLVIGIEIPKALSRYVIEKGSIAIDGISLTVNTIQGSVLSVALIPHSKQETTLASKTIGQTINVEVDLMAKYIEKIQGAYTA